MNLFGVPTFEMTEIFNLADRHFQDESSEEEWMAFQ